MLQAATPSKSILQAASPCKTDFNWMLQVATPSNKNFKVHPCKALQTASSLPNHSSSCKTRNFLDTQAQTKGVLQASSSFLQSRNDTPQSFLQLFFNLSLKPFLPSSKDLPSTSPPLCFLQASGGGWSWKARLKGFNIPDSKMLQLIEHLWNPPSNAVAAVAASDVHWNFEDFHWDWMPFDEDFH